MSNPTYRPKLLQEAAAEALTDGSPHIVRVDAYERQLKELFIIDTPQFIGADRESAFASADFASFKEARTQSAVYAHYPWLNRVVKIVPSDEYFRLKTNRNQDLITAEEQKKLAEYTVGIFGLSVGSNVAFALTQAGISRRIVLADFDELDTTNLNRILAGVHEVGLNKAVIAARRIAEGDPFADVEAMEQGIDAASLERLLKDRRIDCVIDEVDDIRFKVDARKLAMTYKIPVVMVTDNGDGAVLHVERYDIGHDKIFGKDPSYFDSLPAKPSKDEAGRIIMDTIVGGQDRVDPAMLSSVKRVLAHELVSWSQLGTAALLGGIMVTYAVKQIALGKDNTVDIRAFIGPRTIEWSTHA